jgi:hypothetical protein
VIAVDQDSLGASGKVVSRSVDGMAEVDAKALGNFESGEYAVLLLNRGKEPEDITVTWRSLGLQSAAATVRDLWKHADLGSIETGYTATKVAPHGVVMLRVKGAVDWSLPREYEAESSYNSFGGLTHVRAQPPAKDNEPSSGEAEVVDIGGGPENTLQFNELWSDRAGLYNLTIRYTCPDTRQARIRTDGRSPVTVNFPATTEAKYSTVELKIPLQSGRNSVSLDNPTALAPTIDKIIISAVDPR